MAHSISLDRSSQSTLTKAVKNIKTLIKKNELKIRDQCNNDAANAAGKKAVLGKKKTVNEQDSKSAWEKHGRGVVYLSHIPEGFYEEEMHSYFSQFGRVTRLNLVRSRKNGKPKGYAFIEFLYSEVAQVVAETMNNYLMCDRLLKAEYISGDRMYRGMFRNSYIRSDNCPRIKSQRRWIQKINKKLTPEEEAGTVIHEIKRLNKLKEQLGKNGIQLDCQIESSSLTPVYVDISKTGRYPILEVDESDDEVEFKLQPDVTRVLKRRSLMSVPSPSPKKMKAETKKDGSKRKPQRKHNGILAVKCRSTSLLSPSIKKVKDETVEKVCRNKLQPIGTSVMEHKSLPTSLLSPNVKKVKAKKQQDVSDTKSQFIVTKVAECKSFSTSILSPTVKKVKARKNVSKNCLQPSVTSGKKRKFFSTHLLSRNVRKVKARRERGVSDVTSQFTVTDIAEHKPVSACLLSLNVKEVKAEAKKDVSHLKGQPKVTEVVEDKSFSLSMLSPSIKKVGTVSKKNILNRKSKPTVSKEAEGKSTSKSILPSSVKKVKAKAEKGSSNKKSESDVARVVKCKRLQSSIRSCGVKKVTAKGGRSKKNQASKDETWSKREM